ncbi:ATP-dependent DNA helicase RecG [Staphylococcus aureus]|uniref:ATP-dependent DNA helicase RecG n=1 Tax=Staphylococcus aureus TaxID=1280 RepID=A0A380EJ63_STAAU|nr:ATP-dependent DNA helicase RecG [Staphylococcus aureus]
MTIMTQTTDGFELSERDLEMRGPGDFFGVKQSGLPDFLVANLVEDYRMLEVARDEAAELIQSGVFFEIRINIYVILLKKIYYIVVLTNCHVICQFECNTSLIE